MHFICFEAIRHRVSAMSLPWPPKHAPGPHLGRFGRSACNPFNPLAAAKLVRADAATRARLVVRLTGNAEHLLDLALGFLGRAAEAGRITTARAASIESYRAGLLTCTETLPRP